eukprot:96357_1
MTSSFNFYIFLIQLFTRLSHGYQPAFAFTYTDGKANQDWFQIVTSENYKAIYVYAGDVETYCRGVQGSKPSTECIFSGPDQNSFVYYTPFAQQTVAKYAQAGFEVYLNWDGRIGTAKNDYVVNFGELTSTEITAFANATASLACAEKMAGGFGWDVEPYNNNQVPFFEQLATMVKACDKKWGIFAFPNDFNNAMWNTFGTSGYVIDSSYDLSTPCECVEPNKYETLLYNQLVDLKASSAKYNVPYQILLSGSGTTTIYTQYTGGNSCLGGGPVYNYTCPYKMEEWMQSAVNAMNNASLKTDSRFVGIGVYDYTDTNNGGFQPALPPSASLNLLQTSGYWNVSTN